MLNKTKTLSIAALSLVPLLGFANHTQNNPFAGLFAQAGAGFVSSSATAHILNNSKQVIKTTPLSKQGYMGSFGAGYRFPISSKMIIGAGVNVIASNLKNESRGDFKVDSTTVNVDSTTKHDLSYLPYVEFGYILKNNLFAIDGGVIFANTTTTSKFWTPTMPEPTNGTTINTHTHGWLLALHLEQAITKHTHLYERGTYSQLPNQSRKPSVAPISEVNTKNIHSVSATIGITYTF